MPTDTVTTNKGPINPSNLTTYIHPIVKYGKRVFDLCFSMAGLLLLLPILPLIVLAIKLDSKGPILYRQRRAGKSQLSDEPPSHDQRKHCQFDHRNTFSIIKFRSMYTDAEIDGVPRLAEKSDPRITKVGKFLRKTRLDETPQLINVICGDMSLIGPRPERPELSFDIESQRPFFTERTYGVLPGLTGLAQINQSYLDSVNNIDAKLSYDHAYSLALSNPMSWLITDLKIVFKTILTVIKCNG
ncbi:MAG: lipopolysaccharide/colanic/teichoic acid biosynthesis glycosyltransferase [Moritella sp.]|jgi:lipopolysaccharide/colanic/teichoic acid biosynthesis glycosyltransferase